jgi:hypothetical protein
MLSDVMPDITPSKVTPRIGKGDSTFDCSSIAGHEGLATRTEPIQMANQLKVKWRRVSV